MGESRSSKRNQREAIYCRGEGCKNLRHISQLKIMSRYVFFGKDIKKKIHKSKKRYGRKA